MNLEQIGTGYHMLAKPIGPICNLNCEYCFYTEKEALFQPKNNFRMSDKVLESYIQKYITSQDIPEIQFVWHGGEPTLLGLDYFHRVVELQQKYAGNKTIVNSLQTNGTLLDDAWCIFLKEHNFLVGISMDGPQEIHDRYRVDRGGRPTFHRVMNGLKLLQKYEVSYNILLCVTRESARRPKKVYEFIKEYGIQFVQFIPIVERIPDELAISLGLRHATPPSLKLVEQEPAVSPWTVESEQYGDFLIEIFEEWVRNDIGSINIMNFEWALESWLGLPSSICVFSKQCGKAVTVEHNGDVYSCDHYVYPEYQIGNIMTDSPEDMIQSERQVEFGRSKETSLPQVCQNCEVRFACHGECPKHRFLKAPNGEPGLNYLCAGYKKYFHHIHRYMKVMVQLIENGLPAAKIQDVIKAPLIIKQ
jgi:uncharacterized protein